MDFLDGFLNVHPFFVHVPIVLIPMAAIMVSVGQKLRQDGFDTATLLVTVAAAFGALTAMMSGLWAEGTFPHSEALHELTKKHETNGIVLTVLSSTAALLAVAEWRGWISKSLWWGRAAILTFAAVGTGFSAHMGATMVYVHGAAVAPVVQQAKQNAAVDGAIDAPLP